MIFHSNVIFLENLVIFLLYFKGSISMAILVFCKNCNRYVSRKNKNCKRCGDDITKVRKFCVNVSRPNGKRITKVVIGINNAKKIEAKYTSDIQKGDDLYLSKAPIINEIWEKYINAIDVKDKKSIISRWNVHIKPHISPTLRMNSLASHDVQEIIDRMKFSGGRNGTGCSDATRKHVLGLINRLYNWAMKNDYYAGKNPTATIQKPTLNNMVTNHLLELELGRLKAVLKYWKNKGAALVVKFALFTGCRKGEILNLRWDDVDFQNRCIFLKDPKGRPAMLPVSKMAYETLREARKINKHHEFVFANRFGEQRKHFGNTWERIKKRARLPKNFRFHDLRHTFATYLASSGEVSPQVLQRLLNHQSQAMTERYSHLLDRSLRKGVNLIDKVLGPVK
jgi:integrase